tara:strand:+ start:822 stop:1274 length:453 start_codon:yes stop_codon:yes gene_type:complete
MQKFYFKSNDGEEYGPISASDVREWQNQGRMNNESLVRYSNSRDWKPLSDFSELNSPTPTQQGGQDFQPHRGSMILTFGIIGVACCFPFGIAAWVMGHSDIKSIDSGVMDPSGRSMTNGGKICGIISVIITVLGCGLQFALSLLPALSEM